MVLFRYKYHLLNHLRFPFGLEHGNVQESCLWILQELLFGIWRRCPKILRENMYVSRKYTEYITRPCWWTFRNFPATLKDIHTLWFYVKSILADFRRPKTAILTILEALNLDLWEFLHFKMSKNCQKFESQKWSNGQNGSFWFFNMTKIDFT